MPKAKRRTSTRKRRPNPSFSRQSNPGGAITGILMNGLWVGVGMYAGGIISGFTAPIIGGLTGSLGMLGGIANGLITAYLTAWLASRTVGHAELIGAGAFAGTAVSALSSVIGGAGSLVSSVTGGITGGNQPQAPQQAQLPQPQTAAQPTMAAGQNPQAQPAQYAMPSHTFGEMDDDGMLGDSDGYSMKGAAS
jgi:hypothetical protein